jgi:hypothetical protein
LLVHGGDFAGMRDNLRHGAEIFDRTRRDS